MHYSRAWMVLSLVWAAISLLLAGMIADALSLDGTAATVFLWILLIAAALAILAHEFIHPQRPYRKVVLFGAVGLALLTAYVLAEGWRTRELFWVPLAWSFVLWLSDWLFTKAQPTVAAPASTSQEVKHRLKVYADRNIDRTLEGFDANSAEFKKVFLDSQPKGGAYFQIGSVSLIAAKDFLATKFGMEAALSAFFIVFQRLYDDPRDSETYRTLHKSLSEKLSEIGFPNSEEKAAYLTEADVRKVWGLVNDPKYRNKMDELRLAVAMAGLFIGTQLKPPLTEEKDREALMRLMKRTLNRMRESLKG